MIKNTLKNSIPVVVFLAIMLAILLLLYALVPTDPDKRPHLPTDTPEGYVEPNCDCAADLYACEDFPSYTAAQKCYDFCLREVAEDVHGLDEDTDGVACE